MARSEWLHSRELGHLLAALMPPNRLALEISLATGLRIGDVLDMRTELMRKAENGRYALRELKTGKRRRVYIPRELQELAMAQAGKVYIFPHRTSNLAHRTRQAVFKDLARVAGMWRLQAHISPHTARKAWAVEAGLGGIGRNSLLVNPDLGSFLLLGEIVLDAECDRYDEHYAGSGCGGCRRCMESCPAGALVAPVTVDSGVDNAIIPDVYAVDTGRCISALTIERSRGGTPAEPLHGWIYGCDECQTVCPRQIKNPAASKKKHEFF